MNKVDRLSNFMGIFNRVLHHFAQHISASAQKQQDSITQNTNDRLLAQVNRFTSLIRLQDERQLIEVIVGKQGESFQSMIVGVDLYNQQLIIDEFSPRIQNPSALVGQTIILRHQNKQQMLKINSEILSWDESNHTIVLDLPDRVEYQPRRQQERIVLNNNTPLSAVIDPIYGAPWHAGIDNISLGGARILVMGDLRPHLHKHKPLRKCEITLDNGQVISCRAKVKAFSYHGRPFRRTEISIEFETLQNEDLFKLEEFIEQLSMA